MTQEFCITVQSNLIVTWLIHINIYMVKAAPWVIAKKYITSVLHKLRFGLQQIDDPAHPRNKRNFNPLPNNGTM